MNVFIIICCSPGRLQKRETPAEPTFLENIAQTHHTTVFIVIISLIMMIAILIIIIIDNPPRDNPPLGRSREPSL